MSLIEPVMMKHLLVGRPPGTLSAHSIASLAVFMSVVDCNKGVDRRGGDGKRGKMSNSLY